MQATAAGVTSMLQYYAFPELRYSRFEPNKKLGKKVTQAMGNNEDLTEEVGPIRKEIQIKIRVQLVVITGGEGSGQGRMIRWNEVLHQKKIVPS